jgi:protocatechuate 3,4-dioxygenase beta subunit
VKGPPYCASESWLRGYQLTDASGRVTFNTIMPGWYQGRTTHIHLRLRSTYDASVTGGSNTTQLFFAQGLVNELYTSTAPYSSCGTNPTTNASDHVYAQEVKGTNVVPLAGSATTGYTGAITLYVPVTT